MAKGRFLSKSVSTSQKLAKLSSDSPRLLWTWLLPHTDREGRFHADAGIVKGHAVPRLKSHTEKSIEADLQELAAVGLIVIYQVNGDRYLQFTQFDENQPGLRKDREAESQCPPPPKELRSKSGVSPELVGDVSKEALRLKDELTLKDKTGQNPDDLRLVQLLVDLMEQNNPGSSILKRLTPERRVEWANQCRLLREADGRSPDQIEAVVRFSQGDAFWKSNILSMPKLREKWDHLWLKANGSQPPRDRVGASPKRDHDDAYWAAVRAKHKEGDA